MYQEYFPTCKTVDTEYFCTRYCFYYYIVTSVFVSYGDGGAEIGDVYYWQRFMLLYRSILLVKELMCFFLLVFSNLWYSQAQILSHGCYLSSQGCCWKVAYDWVVWNLYVGCLWGFWFLVWLWGGVDVDGGMCLKLINS